MNRIPGSAAIIVTCLLAGFSGCVQRGYQPTQPPGFSSTQQRYLMHSRTYTMQAAGGLPAERQHTPAPSIATSNAASGAATASSF